MKLLKSLCLALLLLAAWEHQLPTESNQQAQLPQWPTFGRDLRNTSNAAVQNGIYWNSCG